MKTKFTHAVFTIAFLLMPFAVYSQMDDKYAITIGELTVGKKYTDEQIFAITDGSPSFLQSSDGRRLCCFDYEGNSFYTTDGVLYCFDLSNDRLKLNGEIGVGDNIDLIAKTCLIQSGVDESGGDVTYHYAYAVDDQLEQSPFIFFVKDNVIIRITYLKHDKSHKLK